VTAWNETGAHRIGEMFTDRFGRDAAEALHGVSVDDQWDTVVVAPAQELRDVFIRQAGWTDWYPGEEYPL
jgi:hypothetical protein